MNEEFRVGNPPVVEITIKDLQYRMSCEVTGLRAEIDELRKQIAKMKRSIGFLVSETMDEWNL